MDNIALIIFFISSIAFFLYGIKSIYNLLRKNNYKKTRNRMLYSALIAVISLIIFSKTSSTIDDNFSANNNKHKEKEEISREPQTNLDEEEKEEINGETQTNFDEEDIKNKVNINDKHQSHRNNNEVMPKNNKYNSKKENQDKHKYELHSKPNIYGILSSRKKIMMI